MKVILGLFALLVCASTLEFDRPCRDDVAAKENFSPAFYTGTWFELFNSLTDGTAECVDHHYTRRGLQQVFDVERIGVIDGEFFTNTGIVSVAFPEEARLTAIFNATIVRDGEEFEYNYRVVATDYTNYAVVWSCTDIEGDRSIEEGGVLSRTTSLNEASMVKVRALLNSFELNVDDFRTIHHTPEACNLAERK